MSSNDGAKIFVSYSRADVAFADQLVAALESFGYRAVIDRHDTSGGEDWKKRLGNLILTADTVVFVMSPHSAVSDICQWEVEETDRLGKRLIPIICAPLGDEKPPERLAGINYIYFYSEDEVPGSGFWTGIKQLDEALRVDIDWIRDGARLAEAAERWDSRGRPDDLLLRGVELKEFQKWRARNPTGSQEIPDIQRAYLSTSEDAEIRRENDERLRLDEREHAIRLTRRRTWYGIIASTFFLIISIIGGYFALAGDVSNTGLRSGLFSKQAEILSNDREQNHSKAILFALMSNRYANNSFLQRIGLKKDLLNNEKERSQAVLARSIANLQLQQTVRFSGANIIAVNYDQDGSRIFISSSDGKIRIQNIEKGSENGIGHLIGRASVINTGDEFGNRTTTLTTTSLSPSSEHLIVGFSDGFLYIRDTERFEVIAKINAHSGKAITSIEVSDDGKNFVTGSLDRTVKIWNFADGELVKTLDGHKYGAVNAVAFSPSGRFVASGSTDKSLKIWNIESGRVVRAFDVANEKGVLAVAFHPDGRMIAAGSGSGIVNLWNVSTGELVSSFFDANLSEVTSIVFSPDGDHILMGTRNNTAIIWDPRFSANAKILSGHNDRINSVAFHPLGNQIVTGSSDGDVMLWSATKHHPISTFTDSWDGGITSISFSPNGKIIASGSADNSAKLWDSATGDAISTLNGHAGADKKVTSIAFSADGETIITGSEDNTAVIWDARSAEVKSRLIGHADSVIATAISANGRMAVTGSSDGTGKLWDTQTGEEIKHFADFGGSVLSIAFCDLDTQIALATKKGKLLFWNLKTERERSDILEFFPTEDVSFQVIAISDDCMRFAAIQHHSNFALVFDIQQTTLTIVAQLRDILSAAFSRSGDQLITGSVDHTLRIFDSRSGRELQTLRGHNYWVSAVAFDSSDSRIVTGSFDRTANVWRVAPVLQMEIDKQINLACKLAQSTQKDQFQSRDKELYVLLDDIEEGWSPCD